MGLFSSSSKKSTSTSSTKSIDARIGVEGGAGQVVGQGATVASPGSIATSVGDFSTMTQNVTGNKFKVGMSGAEVSELLNAQASIASESLGKVADFAAASLAATSTALTGQIPNWQRYIPYAIGAVAAIAIWRAGR